MLNFHFPIRVYYEDTDAGGVVYHARYLQFAERARTEYLRSLGFENHTLAQNHQLLFVVKRFVLECFKPSYLDDLLLVKTKVTGLRGARFELEQTIWRDSEKIATGGVMLATINTKTRLPMRIPKILKDALLVDPFDNTVI